MPNWAFFILQWMFGREPRGSEQARICVRSERGPSGTFYVPDGNYNPPTSTKIKNAQLGIFYFKI
jgi:hypothetical protein